MPTYQYKCTECGAELDVIQKFSDASLTECPTCAGSLRKVFNAVGVVFKGSGFYRNDSRASANGDGKSEPTKTDTKTAEKPADAKPAKSDSGKPEKASRNGSSSSSTAAKAAAN